MNLNLNLKMPAVALLIALLSIMGACDTKSNDNDRTSGTKTTAASDGRCPHEIKKEKCPFCNPALVESEGYCGEHGVAEALCVGCRSYLKAAFRAKGDWCKEHETPESQCVTCRPELKDKIKAGAGHGVATPTAGKAKAVGDTCEHTIAKAKCPFCTPSLIESGGFCKEHNIAEALCVQCRPDLEAAFKAKGDWCNEHKTPESQCAECNPELKDKPKGNG